MIKRKFIKKLAENSIKDGIVEKKIANFVLSKLSKKELKIYLFYLKKFLSEKKVTVLTAHELSDLQMKQIKNLFPGKQILFLVERGLGAGIKIKKADIILDFSAKGLIEQITRSAISAIKSY